MGAVSAAAGCAAIAGIEETTTIAPEGGVPESSIDASLDAADAEDIIEIPDATPPPVDAALCADAAARVKGSSAVIVATANGLTCGAAENVLVENENKSVGLDWDQSVGGVGTRWEGDRAVHGCVGVAFDGDLTAVVVRARMVGTGCNNPCTTEGCNTYRYFGTWLRQADGGMHFIVQQPIERETYGEYVVLLADGGVVTDPFVTICRTSLAPWRDDIDVDYIGGCR